VHLWRGRVVMPLHTETPCRSVVRLGGPCQPGEFGYRP